MGLATAEITVDASNARSLRENVLDKRRLDGLTYAIVSPWWWLFSTRFCITAPPGVLESTKALIESWRDDVWADRQW